MGRLQTRFLKLRPQIENADKENGKQRAAELEEAMDKFSREVLEYAETLVRRLVGKVTVLDDHSTVECKSGIDMYVRL